MCHLQVIYGQYLRGNDDISVTEAWNAQVSAMFRLVNCCNSARLYFLILLHPESFMAKGMKFIIYSNVLLYYHYLLF
jgi:hypothetical protein